MPREMVEQIRKSEQFAALVPLAQSTVYDAKLTAQVSTPTPEMLSVSQPVTILRGEQTFPILVTAADRLAEEMERGGPRDRPRIGHAQTRPGRHCQAAEGTRLTIAPRAGAVR